MPRLIKKDHGNYTNISNVLVRDSRLTWKARGIFLYLWSQADNWQFYVKELLTHAPEGKESLQNGLKELEEYGYLQRINRHSDKSGKFGGLEWILDDTPANGKNSQNSGKKSGLPSDGKTVQRENRPPENSSLRNNNNKKYQMQEVTTERKEYSSPAKKQDEPPIPYKEIIDYLNQKTGAHYKPSSKANQRLIKARFKEGYKLDDFTTVIDNKAFEWQHTDMWQFMRPSTLFSPSHFDDYLNANNLDKHKNKPTGGGYDSTQVDLSGVNDDDLPF